MSALFGLASQRSRRAKAVRASAPAPLPHNGAHTMSTPVLRLWVRSQCSRHVNLHSFMPNARHLHHLRRTYATHNMDFGNTNSQLLNESANAARRRSEPKHDHVGPFQLGLSPSALRQGEKVQKWSELSTSGKGAHCFFLSGYIVSFQVYDVQSCEQQPGQQTLESFSSALVFQPF